MTREYIAKIKNRDKKLVYSTSEVTKVFQEFYTKLYNIGNQVDREPVREYIRRTDLPVLEADEIQLIERPFTEEELNKTIGGLKSGKSPGPDGFTASLYKQYREELTPILCEVFNTISDTCLFPKQAQQAHISLILKEKKDPTECTSYRPISLINIDLKLYAKIIANRIKDIVPKVIHMEQSGFVSGREARDNTIRTITLIAHAKKQGIPLCLLALDAEKAFDRLSWEFLQETLNQIGFSGPFVAKIMALYDAPSARIKVNGMLSEPVQVGNGTRQGCPLSPLLYVLAMEHFAIDIRRNISIQGIQTRSLHHKLSMFADDVLMYVTNPTVAFPSIMKATEEFGKYSNFKVNLSKSQVLNVSLKTEIKERLEGAFPFRWSTVFLKYLGVNIPADVKLVYELNYFPLLLATQERLQTWTTKNHTWFGRMSLFKMDILPRFLYLFQTLPIRVPTVFFRRLRSALIGYIWRKSTPRLRYEILIQSKERGGLGLPNMYWYYISAVLTRIVDWHWHADTKLWVNLEQDLSWAILTSLPWIHPRNRSNKAEVPILVQTTLQIWDRVMRKYGISTRVGPMTPILGNMDFEPGLQAEIFLCWTRGSPSPIEMGLGAQGLKPVGELTLNRVERGGYWLEYFQLRDFFLLLTKLGEVVRPLTDFEKLCREVGKKDHNVAKIYNIIRQTIPEKKPYFAREWEREFGYSIEESTWKKSYCLTLGGNIDSRSQERNYKILTRWYRCPERLARFDPQASGLCWRCGVVPGSMLHIWWGCDKLRLFWQAVFEIGNRVTEGGVLESPEIALLSMVPDSVARFRKGIWRFLLSAARALIARRWKTDRLPTIGDWIVEVNEVRHMEELMAISNDRDYNVNGVWDGWKLFVTSL